MISANDKIPNDIKVRYQIEGSNKIISDKSFIKAEIMETDLLSFDNGVVRHDIKKVKKILERILD
ncbi:MAG: hypothetical protein ACK5G7_00200 [Erysipelotrichaceae bacterium]